MGLEKPLTVDSQYDVDKQVSDVETMVNDEYDAIMISPIDQNALTDVVTKANEAGVVTSCAAQSVDIVDFRYIVEESHTDRRSDRMRQTGSMKMLR